ncbi:hypothetical protein PAHAL_4G019500 [Panicum hallii]|uniref:Uncharacterized protein n=1 Tax=Panicum hallii TaxID=206008 RepID=A0A2T8JBG2_9POAL|nr:hypothetical protein PAHAL_4G019500 [Panicum hallii]
MGVDRSSSMASILPTVCVRNCVPAACASCSAQGISTMRHPSRANTSRKASARARRAGQSPTRTLSNTKGRPAQPSRADSGPNMGCVQMMSNSSGSAPRRRFLGNSLTESTSAKRVSRRRRCTGSERTTASAERMEVARSSTSGWHSQRSCGSGKNRAPRVAAAAE